MKTYKNPILYADYSDPDVVRVGEDYFMVASSFCNAPAIPVLHSKDLVHWKVINYVLDKLPYEAYDTPAHGQGVWAPAIRHHNGLFYVVYPMPDEGIFCCTTKDPFGKWSEPVTIRAGKGWIDPCPFWDDDGKAYMVSAFAKSRIGFKSILNLAEMKPDCTGLIDDGRHIFDGHDTQPTIEGPKMHKRNGYYYILAPAGGVKHGWQTTLRSKNIWGPYEEKIVMMRGGTNINGPHQGALVDTPSGETWFIHFQDVGACGRIVHLQPVEWVSDWPIIGDDSGKEGCGSPVSEWKTPNVGREFPAVFPDASDEFDGDKLGLQWQWNSNPKLGWYCIKDSHIHLHAQPHKGALCDAPHLLLQKYMSKNFNADAKINISGLAVGTMAGMVVLGKAYNALAVRKTAQGLEFLRIQGEIGKGETETVLFMTDISGAIYMRLSFFMDMYTQFAYGISSELLMPVDEPPFISTPGVWVGSKFGFFAIGEKGSIAIDWLKVDTLEEENQ